MDLDQGLGSPLILISLRFGLSHSLGLAPKPIDFKVHIFENSKPLLSVPRCPYFYNFKIHVYVNRTVGGACTCLSNSRLRSKGN